MNIANPTPNPLDPQKDHLSYLLAYDRSPHAMAALELLLDMPEKSGIPPKNISVTLMTVLPTQSIEVHELLQADLAQERERLSKAGFQVEVILKAGNPAATINEYAEENQSDLILIGAKGLRAALGVLLGGVAQQVVEYSTRPVLVVRAPYKGLWRILLVVDGSVHSRKAVEYLVPRCPDGSRQRCSWLPKTAEITALNVLPPPISAEPVARAWTLGPEALYPSPLPPVDKEAIEAAEQKQGEKLIAETLSLLGEAGVRAESRLVRGDAADQILQTIRDQKINLVVCGSRGLSAITGWLLGSVSRKLVHYAECSVLIIK
jgi:nucleotide-binding universal stress UspA family protein